MRRLGSVARRQPVNFGVTRAAVLPQPSIDLVVVVTLPFLSVVTIFRRCVPGFRRLPLIVVEYGALLSSVVNAEPRPISLFACAVPNCREGGR